MASYDIIGNIAILKFQKSKISDNSQKSFRFLKFPEKTKANEKKKIANRLLKEHKNIKTILEKRERVKGRLRTYKTRFLAGIKTKETIHKESGCRFKLDVEKCYFSPRLSNERIEIAKEISRKDNVLVMFAGVAPYSIIIAKLAKPKKVVAVEINRKASKYAEENVKLNKLNNVEIIQGDVKKVLSFGKRNKTQRIKEKFSVIVMPRPQLKESFLKLAFSVSKKGTKIFYYDFGKDVSGILERVYRESRKAGKKIVILKVKKAGEIAPYKFRWRVDLRVLG